MLDQATETVQEMEQDRLRREQEEKDKAEKAKKIKEQFGDPNSQWEKDKSELQNLAAQDKSSKGDEAPADGQKDKAGTESDTKKGAEAVANKEALKKDEGAQAQPNKQI
jgi:mannan polymerase II complex ANP1 subunit